MQQPSHLRRSVPREKAAAASDRQPLAEGSPWARDCSNPRRVPLFEVSVPSRGGRSLIRGSILIRGRPSVSSEDFSIFPWFFHLGGLGCPLFHLDSPRPRRDEDYIVHVLGGTRAISSHRLLPIRGRGAGPRGSAEEPCHSFIARPWSTFSPTVLTVFLPVRGLRGRRRRRTLPAPLSPGVPGQSLFLQLLFASTAPVPRASYAQAPSVLE